MAAYREHCASRHYPAIKTAAKTVGFNVNILLIKRRIDPPKWYYGKVIAVGVF